MNTLGDIYVHENVNESPMYVVYIDMWYRTSQ